MDSVTSFPPAILLHISLSLFLSLPSIYLHIITSHLRLSLDLKKSSFYDLLIWFSCLTAFLTNTNEWNACTSIAFYPPSYLPVYLYLYHIYPHLSLHFTSPSLSLTCANLSMLCLCLCLCLCPCLSMTTMLCKYPWVPVHKSFCFSFLFFTMLCFFYFPLRLL